MVYRRKFLKKRKYGKRRMYKKKSYRVKKVYKKQVRLIKRVIQKQAEVKQLIVETLGYCMNGEWISISTTNFAPTIGTGTNQRVGEKVFLKSMSVQLVIVQPTRPQNLGEYSATYMRSVFGILKPRPAQPLLDPTGDYDYTVTTSRILDSTLPADYYNEVSLASIPWRVLAGQGPDLKVIKDKCELLQFWDYNTNAVDQYPFLQTRRTSFPIIRKWNYKMNKTIFFNGGVQRGFSKQLLMEFHFPTQNVSVCHSPFSVTQIYYYTDI